MKILIVGASGYLGNTIYKKLKEGSNDDIYGTCCNSSNQELLKINVLNKLDIKKVLSFKPDIIIWSIYDVEKEMSLSQIGINEIINGISEDVRLIYVSTTVGEGKQQAENIIPHKRMPDEYFSKYINGKIEGESIVRKHPNHVIVRPGSIYGYDYDGKIDSRMKGLLEILKTGKRYSRTANMYASFVNVCDLADAIIELAYSNFIGIINVAGERAVSHYDFNIHLARLMDIDNSFIIPDYKQDEVYHNINNDKRKLLLNTLVRDI
ncbi:sugar nucleotide-binding protein [Clostridium tagluense]|uniref:sugar nucleotide-binding protein n=1 Tax=Clostridium tagluense TaxID=360422 RepID=UPI001CF153A1|nr:sugar nucleotide-binding protein [Clostridium tagluense]MCB2312834.1 sugar nucleotide-binding protein [Clostridium tagluense]MCB2317600.1 sugar nucleotide-binding protein [Clostridium tagluense]MCB2322309.1 sugar nucleotide-binding protein [Clostridium tagluense]MCB2327313.1 sugar nucleotide-binding protein [Clostridium tagluense]MCB2332032.1 sugar nucleotide-binding protein [Clostridium tagluense]